VNSRGEGSASPWTPLWLSALAWVSFAGLLPLASSIFSPLSAMALSEAVAFGIVGALGAALPPPMEAEQLGMREIPRRFLLPILFLLPLIFLSSEVDNWIRALAISPTPIESDTPMEWLDLLELWIALVAIQPIVEEWFFRGVIQERLRPSMSEGQTIVASAGLFAIAATPPFLDPTTYASYLSGALIAGLAAAAVRARSGSLFAAILLRVGMSAIAALAISFKDALPIPGFSGGGAHSPLSLLLLSLLSVALGGLLLARARRGGEG